MVSGHQTQSWPFSRHPEGASLDSSDLLANHVIELRNGTEFPLCHSVPLTISYNGVTCTPSVVDAERNLSPGFGLAARILWSHFVLFSDKVTSSHFEKFCCTMRAFFPDLNPSQAVQVVIAHQKRPVLLLVDELIKSEYIAAEWPFKILSCIGILLDDIAMFSSVETSLKPRPVLRVASESGRQVQWIQLPPFTLQESESLDLFKLILEEYTSLGMDEVVKLCVSDVGGHPRGLELL